MTVTPALVVARYLESELGCQNEEPRRRRPAYAYVAIAQTREQNAETRLRRELVQFAALESLDLRSVFVDQRSGQPYGFAALRALIARSGVRLVVLPSLDHVGHIPAVAHLSRAGLARYLGAAVLLSRVGDATDSTGSMTGGW